MIGLKNIKAAVADLKSGKGQRKIIAEASEEKIHRNVKLSPAELLKAEYQKRIDDILYSNGIKKMIIELRNTCCEQLNPLDLTLGFAGYHVTPWHQYRKYGFNIESFQAKFSAEDAQRYLKLRKEGFYEGITEHDAKYLTRVYKELNELTVRYGDFFIAYRKYRLTDAKVKSRNGPYDEHYAPDIIEMEPYSSNMFERDAKRLAESLKAQAEGYHQMKISVEWKDEKNKKDLHDTYLIVYHIIQIVNLCSVEIYRLLNTDKDYQYRDDWNPELF